MAGMAMLNNAALGQRDKTSVSLHQRAIRCKTDESQGKAASFYHTVLYLMVAVPGGVLREKINSPLLMECIGGTSQPLLQSMLPKSDSPGVHRHLFRKGITRKSNRMKTSSSSWYLVSKLQLLSGALLLYCPVLMSSPPQLLLMQQSSPFWC